ncbi:MAG TPA: C-terminal binding protein [Anaerolineales bacterium]|nr:C-terminal binding protein [Anaerolineales bacterium]
MTWNIVIACIDTRNPPEALNALAGLDVAVHRVIGFHDERQASLYREADAIITEMHPVTDVIMETFSGCRIIACASTGYDYVDHASAGKRGIWVTNCPGYCTDEVATHTIALLLSQVRRLPQVRQLVRANEWDPRPVRPMHHPRNQTLGIIGWGRIGRSVSAKAMALGFQVIANDPYVDPKQMLDAGVKPVEKETLMRESDYVTLHTPLTEETHHMIDEHLLSLMRPSAYLINTARGLLIQEEALLDAVQNDRIAGAALDVLSVEPPSPEHPFLHDDRFFITPHSAWCSEEADAAVWEWAAGDIAYALRGERPPHAVNEI